MKRTKIELILHKRKEKCGENREIIFVIFRIVSFKYNYCHGSHKSPGLVLAETIFQPAALAKGVGFVVLLPV